MFNRLRIRTKIFIAFSIVAAVAIITIAILAFLIGSRTLRQESFNKLTAVRETKAREIENYFQVIQDQATTFSDDLMIVDAMRALDNGLHLLGEEISVAESAPAAADADLETYYEEEFFPRLAQNLADDVTLHDFWPKETQARLLQHRYIAENPFEVGSKQLLDDAGDGSSYSRAHQEFHPIIRDYLEKFGYYDIFLVNVGTGGQIVYTVFKEVDLGTSLVDGPYANSNIGRAYKAVVNSDDRDAVFLVDYEPYAPSYNAPAAFAAAPIFDGDQRIGVLIFQLPIDRIDAIMTNQQDWRSVGLGESGETYLVGDDFRLRNQSRFLIEDSEDYFDQLELLGTPIDIIDRIRNLYTTIGLQEVRTKGVLAALNGETGTDTFPDYRDVPVLSSYKPLDIEGLHWVIMSEIDEAEAFASVRALGMGLFLASIGLVLFIIIASTVFAGFITGPIENLQTQANRISVGNLDTQITVDTLDEIGDLASTLETMRLSNKALIDDLADINQNLENLIAERTAELEASERQSSSIIELSSDAIIVVDALGRTIVWNARAEQIFGYSRQEMIGNPMDQIVADSLKASHDQAFDQARDMHGLAKPGVIHELSARKKNGQEFPIELSLSHWQLGAKDFFSASIRDITERKQSEQAIREREERIRSIVEIAPDAIISVNEEQKIVMFNAQAEAIFGYSANEVLGQPLTMLMPERSRDSHPAEVEGFRHESVSTRFMDARREIAGRRKDGTIFPAEAGISKLQLDGKILYTTFFRDITERKEAERKLSESEAKHRTIFQNSPLGMILFSSDGVILDCNDRFVELMGSSREQLIGFHTLRNASNPEVRQGLAQALAGTQSDFEGEYRSVTGDSARILRIIYNPVDPGQSPTEVIATLEDISERKEMERLLQIANERMSTELNFARDIQLSMLPLIFPAFPTRKDVTVYATLESAREVGGDFYDFYFLDDDHLCFVIGDVAGKGAPGALMMAVSKTLIKSRAADDSEPASILTHVNDELARDNKSSMFVTVFLAVLNVKTGEIIYTNAGHNPPYIRRRDGSLQKIDAFHGPVIGAMPGLPYQQDKDLLRPGDVILLYTDGVTEAFNNQEELFSENRLEAVLHSGLFKTAEDIIHGTIDAVSQFAGTAEQSDDITLIAVQHQGLPQATETQTLALAIKNRFEDMAIVEEKFAEFARLYALPNDVRQSISVVLDELLNNIISYGYPGEKEKEIQVDFELSGRRLVLTIRDSGIPFNPFEQGAPDLSGSLEEREIGGLGIHLVRNLMDEHSYQRQINRNVITLVKLIGE